MENLYFSLPGRHNLMNALMALAMAKTYGTPTKYIARALASFKGIQRRFSYQIKEDGLIYIDDYAHHPTEINAVYQAVSELYPNRKILAIFQPHLFSRTRDFADEFATSLSQFHEILLLDIYPAREIPIEGITSKWLLSKIANKARVKQSLADYRKHIQKTTKSGSLMSRQAHMELILQSDYSAGLGETIYYINNGFKKSDGDVQRVTKATKKQQEDYLEKHGTPIPENYIQINCYMIPEKDIVDNPDLTGEYNIDRYLTNFNKRVETVLVAFNPSIREDILI